MVLQFRDLESSLGGGVLRTEGGVGPQVLSVVAPLGVLAGEVGTVLQSACGGEEVCGNRFLLGAGVGRRTLSVG